MKRKKNEEKELPGGVKWASPTDKVYNIGLVVGGIPVSAVRPKKRSVWKKLKDRFSPKKKGK